MENIYVLFLEDYHLSCRSGGGNIFRKGEVQRLDIITEDIIVPSGERYFTDEIKKLKKAIKIVSLSEKIIKKCPTCKQMITSNKK